MAAKPADFDATAPLFEPKALTDAKGMDFALEHLQKLLKSRSKQPLDERWAGRLVELFRTPFPANHRHESSRSLMMRTAGSLLVKLRPKGVGKLLMAALRDPKDERNVRHLYLVELIGKLGEPKLASELCDWFEKQSARTISLGSIWSLHAMVPDALIRLGSAATFARIQKALAEDAKGKRSLSGHHRWSYERALEVMMKKGPPDVGTKMFPEP